MSGFADFLVNHHVPQAVTSTEQPKGEDIFESNVSSDVINLSAWEGVVFIVTKLAGATGTATATINSCDNVTPSTATAVAFRYRYSTTPDTFTAWADATSSGVAITAGADEVWEFAIASSDLYKGTATAPVNDQYVRLVLTETESTAVDGSVATILYGPKYGHEIPGTVLT